MLGKELTDFLRWQDKLFKKRYKEKQGLISPANSFSIHKYQRPSSPLFQKNENSFEVTLLFQHNHN